MSSFLGNCSLPQRFFSNFTTSVFTHSPPPNVFMRLGSKRKTFNFSVFPICKTKDCYYTLCAKNPIEGQHSLKGQICVIAVIVYKDSYRKHDSRGKLYGESHFPGWFPASNYFSERAFTWDFFPLCLQSASYCVDMWI